MRYERWVVSLGVCALLACESPRGSAPLTPDQAVAVSKDVRGFMSEVADGVSTRGPAAWRDYFADTPQFFMASEGRLTFPSGEAAAQGIEGITRSISHIELRWGHEVRVDPLTSTLAIVAVPFHESLVLATGRKVEEDGYFTGLTELGSKGWRFRNAHWSVAAPPVVPP